MDGNDTGGAPGFAHTPWDGSHPAFRIGLHPLGNMDWLEVDGEFESQLAEKHRLLETRYQEVFRAEPASEAAQTEALELVLAQLEAHHTATHHRTGDSVTAAGFSVDLANPDMPPLEKAARMIQEDLVIMMRGEDGWRLVAGCVCFPSSWVLAEKFGKPLQQVHASVPEFGPGSKNALVINRIFDNLKPTLPVWRLNWSVYPDGELFHGADKHGKPGNKLADPWLRVEFQTLHKLAETGAILFTIRIHLDPLALIANHPDAKRLAGGMAASLAALDEDQQRYKGLVEARGELIARLEAIAGFGN